MCCSAASILICFPSLTFIIIVDDTEPIFLKKLNTANLFCRWQPLWVQSQRYLCSSSLASLLILTRFPNTYSGALMSPTSGTVSYFQFKILVQLLIVRVLLNLFESVAIFWSEWLSLNGLTSDTALRAWYCPSMGWTGQSWSVQAMSVSFKSQKRSCSC